MLRGGLGGMGARGGVGAVDQDPIDGSIGSADLADGSVTTAKLAALAVTLAKLDVTGLTGIAKGLAGALTAATNGIDFVGPQKTANVASATTLPAIPETGLLVPVTGTTTIDYMTVPTGSAPRYVILWFQSAIAVRNNVAGAGAGAANIRMMTGAAVNQSTSFAANSLCPMFFDGSNWRLAHDAPHWDGSAVQGNSAIDSKVILNDAVGARLSCSTATRFDADGTRNTITAPITRFTTRMRYDQVSVASAATIALPDNCSTILITGTTQVNSWTFTAGTMETATIVWLRFDNALTLKHNAGGTRDFMTTTGLDITTAAGLVLPFFFDGTDLVEIGR